MSTKKSKNKATITQQRIKSSKGLLVICSSVALLTNIAILAVLLMNVSEWTFWICPVILLALNAWFLGCSIHSNYRFAYAIHSVWFHVVLVLLASISSWVLTWYLESRIVFETIALYALPATHIVQCVTVLTTSMYAHRKGKILHRSVALLATIAFVASAGIYSAFLFTEGFFGQGFVKEHRILVYSYDKINNCYIAEDVLDGRGGTIVIPSEFDGIPVGGINCELFENEELKMIHLDCDTGVAFQNVSALSGTRTNLEFYSSREKIDEFRQVLYEMRSEDKDTISLANIMAPDDIDTTEVYITFQYTEEILDICNNKILPVWIAQKNTKFDFDEYANNYDFLKHSNSTSDADLYFCYTNQNGKIFSGIVGNDNTNPNGQTIKESSQINFLFDKIYRVRISEDNDTKYTIDESIRFTQTVDGEMQYKLTTAEHANSIIAALPQRPGFELTWKVDSREMQSVASELSALDAVNQDTLSLSPEWSLNLPTIHSITVNGINDQNSAIYGDNVNLVANAISPDPSISIRYEWKKGNTVLDSTDSINQIENLHPSDAGRYDLTVTAYSDQITSLTSQTSKSASVSFIKKDLNISWILPENTTYSATEKQVSVEHDESDVINNDNITIKLQHDTIKNAKTYQLSASLTGDSDTKYTIVTADATCLLTIQPYSVSVNWTNLSLVYSGSNQSPSASAPGLGSDTINIAVIGQQKNAGTYSATATTTNTNYKLLDEITNFTIEQRPITIEAWDTDTFFYNAQAQGPIVTRLNNVVVGETQSVLQGITYDERMINANIDDPYEIKAILPTNGNYCFAGSDTTTFTILPAELTITVNDFEGVYTGSVFTEFTISNEGLQGNDKIEEVLSVVYKGPAATAINVATYEIDADVIGNDKFSNYVVTVIPGTLEITPKFLSIELIPAIKVYDGSVYPYEDFDFVCSGLADTDTIEEICQIMFDGAALSAINASLTPYALTATAKPLTKYYNYSISISESSLKIDPAPLTVTAIGGTKIYDNTIGSGFSIIVSGLQGTDTVEMLEQPIFSGKATTSKNAGAHDLFVSIPSNETSRNYDITYVSGIYEITPKDLTVTAVDTTKIYDGKKGSTFSFTVDGLVSGDSQASLGNPTYGGAATTNKNVGTYELTVSLPSNTTTRNYNITYIPGEFSITPRSIAVSIREITKTYDGLIEDTFAFQVDNLASTDTIAVLGTPYYSGSATTAYNAGTYELSVLLPGNDNYIITSYTSGTFIITPARLTITPTATSRVYDGSIGGEFDFTVSGLVSTDSRDLLGAPVYGGNATEAKNAGDHTLTIQFPDYQGQNYIINCNFGILQITKKALTITAIGTEKTYDGQLCDSFNYEIIGLVNGDEETLGAPTYSGNAVTAKNVGTYSLSVRFPSFEAKNYSVTYNQGTLKINKKDLTVSVISAEKDYDGKVYSSFQIEAYGLVDGETKAVLGTPTYTGSAATAKNVGIYTISVQFPSNGGQNYNITCIDGTLEITPIDVTITVQSTQKVYDGKVCNSFSFVANGLVNGETKSIFGTPKYTGDAATAKNVGIYTISVEFPSYTGQNYNLFYVSGTLEITKKDVTVNAVAPTKVYNGKPCNSFDFQVVGLASGETKSIFGEPSYSGDAITATDVGTYTIFVELPNYTGQNYNISYVSGTLEITKRNLTVTAVDFEKVYDGKVCDSFDFEVSGLIEDQTEQMLGTPIYSGNAATATDVGTYTISVQFPSFTDPNYNVTYVSGTLKITKKELTITAVALEKVYDGKICDSSEFDFEVSGLIDGETKQMLGTPTYSGNAITAIQVGEYTLKVRFNNSAILANYSVSYVDATLVISQANEDPAL